MYAQIVFENVQIITSHMEQHVFSVVAIEIKSFKDYKIFTPERGGCDDQTELFELFLYLTNVLQKV
jgi:hypothetical protein